MVNIIVSTELDGEYVDVGDLLFTPLAAGSYISRFRYDAEYVARGYQIDPALRLDTAPHELPGLPLAVEDAAPDGWGEALLQRAERIGARQERRGGRSLTPDTYLLAASDATRQGALRFRTEQDGPFLDDGTDIPRHVDMAALLADAEEVAADPNTDNWEAVRRLLRIGSSALGGARPKAAVVAEDGGVWLAKFPRTTDENDVPVWEMVGLDIAERAGLRVPQRRLVAVGAKSVLLVRRFDRGENGERVGYISTRTLLGARGASVTGDYGAGRNGIAARLRHESTAPREDMEQVFKQAALNLFINNTDNHLRNFGLLRDGRGWRWAPVFDLDPNPDTGTEFHTQVNGAAYRSSGLRNLPAMAADLGIKPARARDMLAEVHEAVQGWEELADHHRANGAEVAMFEDAFTGLDNQVHAMLATPAEGSTA